MIDRVVDTQNDIKYILYGLTCNVHDGALEYNIKAIYKTYAIISEVINQYNIIYFTTC